MLQDVLDVVFNALSDCMDNIVMPIGKKLMPTFFILVCISIISTIASAIGIYTVLDYRGCWLCTALMLILCYKERRSNSDILRLYGIAKLCSTKVKCWKEGSSSSSSDTGDSGDSISSNTEVDESGESSNQL